MILKLKIKFLRIFLLKIKIYLIIKLKINLTNQNLTKDQDRQNPLTGSFTVILVSILANAGGIGGGALLTPIYIWLFNFAVEDAIPLSKMTIFTGAIVNYFLLKNARLEKNPNSPLINYQMAGIVIPMLLAGTVVGVFGAKVFPPVLILSFLLCFLLVSICSMFKKAVKMWKKETELLNHKNKSINQEEPKSKDYNRASFEKQNFLKESCEEKESLLASERDNIKENGIHNILNENKSFLVQNKENEILKIKESALKTEKSLANQSINSELSKSKIQDSNNLNEDSRILISEKENSKVLSQSSRSGINPYWTSKSDKKSGLRKIQSNPMSGISKFKKSKIHSFF